MSRFVEAALDGAMRAGSLTQRLLAFSRQQTLSPVPVDTNKLLIGMEDLLHRTLGETVQVETVLAANLWLTHATPASWRTPCSTLPSTPATRCPVMVG